MRVIIFTGGEKMTVREITKMILSDGWYFVRQKGSHKQYRHSSKSGLVTIPNHSGDLNPKTASTILKQAGLK